MLVAHNIERISSEDGLDEMMSKILRLCSHSLDWTYSDETKSSSLVEHEREVPVPVIYGDKRTPRTRAASMPDARA